MYCLLAPHISYNSHINKLPILENTHINNIRKKLNLENIKIIQRYHKFYNPHTAKIMHYLDDYSWNVKQV